jgi:orotidine-5'-phosphate decarboxylase
MSSPLLAPEPRDLVAVALDFPSASEALDLVDRLEGRSRWFKVGMELYYTAGASFVHLLRDRGFEVFLDLKLHDIPTTVAGGVRSVSKTGASLLTIHASGGERMMAAAAEAALLPGAPRLLAVTVLTSMDTIDLIGIGIDASPAEHARRLATLAEQCGITGFVCSPREIALLRESLAPNALLVVPGIRPSDSQAGDQRRTATPAAAIRDGASLLVVGRPITQASDPAAALAAIQQEIAASLEIAAAV